MAYKRAWHVFAAKIPGITLNMWVFVVNQPSIPSGAAPVQRVRKSLKKINQTMACNALYAKNDKNDKNDKNTRKTSATQVLINSLSPMALVSDGKTEGLFLSQRNSSVKWWTRPTVLPIKHKSRALSVFLDCLCDGQQ